MIKIEYSKFNTRTNWLLSVALLIYLLSGTLATTVLTGRGMESAGIYPIKSAFLSNMPRMGAVLVLLTLICVGTEVKDNTISRELAFGTRRDSYCLSKIVFAFFISLFFLVPYFFFNITIAVHYGVPAEIILEHMGPLHMTAKLPGLMFHVFVGSWLILLTRNRLVAFVIFLGFSGSEFVMASFFPQFETLIDFMPFYAVDKTFRSNLSAPDILMGTFYITGAYVALQSNMSRLKLT